MDEEIKRYVKYLRINATTVLEMVVYTYDAKMTDCKGQMSYWTMTEIIWQQVMTVLQQQLLFKIQKETDMKRPSSFITDIYRGSNFQMAYQLRPLEDRSAVIVRVSLSNITRK
jgi:NADH:ubiquinone oxidoreductase subunit C